MTRTRNLADLLDSGGDVKTAALDNVTATSLSTLGLTATAAELNYVDGVTSAIQTQIDNINTDLVNDTTPQLGGNLDVNGNSIVSVSNGNIAITPNGTGSVVIDGLSHPQSDGSAGQFLKTDGSGQLAFATVDQPSNATTSTAGLMSAADKTKTDGIEALADVTDATNVASAGAAMLSGASFTGAVDVDAALTANSIALDNGSNDWQFSVSGNNLIIAYGGTNKAKLDSSGNLTVVGNVTAFGSI